MADAKVSNVRRGAAAQTQHSDVGTNGLLYKTDASGRRIGVRKLSMLDRMRLFRVVGADNAANDRYLSMAVLAASVGEIDGEPQPFPRNGNQVEAMIGELDEVGTDAVAEAVAELFDATPEEELARRKKIAGDPDMIEVALLAKNGVPWDVALSMSGGERFGLYVIFAGFEGNIFDFATGKWKRRP